MLMDVSLALEQQVNKVVLGWPSMRTADEKSSLMSALLAKVEPLVTCGFLLTSDGPVSCEAARAGVAASVDRVCVSVASLLEHLATAHADTDTDANANVGAANAGVGAATHQQVAVRLGGAIWEACAAVRLLPKTNRAAARRQVMKDMALLKDTQQEFGALLASSMDKGLREGGSDGDGDGDSDGGDIDGDDGELNADLEVGSDEWYAMMDADADDDLLDEQESLRLDQALADFGFALAALQAAGGAIGTSKEWIAGGGIPADFVRWLNLLTRASASVIEATGNLGMTMYPPHDADKANVASAELMMRKQALDEVVAKTRFAKVAPSALA